MHTSAASETYAGQKSCYCNPLYTADRARPVWQAERLRCAAGYLAHGTATDYMYDRLNVPLSLTWEIYGDTEATFNDCFRMFNPTTRERFEEVRLCHTEWD